jgi:hypothetical protein
MRCLALLCLLLTACPEGDDDGADAQVPDAQKDAAIDSGVDTGVDTGIDLGVDTGIDLGVDTGVEMDAAIDGGEDASEADAAEDSGVDPCDPNPCFAGVACTPNGADFTCGACPSGLDGDGVTCTEIDGCAGSPCFAGTTCTDVPAPGVGFTCTRCTGPSCPILRALAGPDQEIIAGAIAQLVGDAVGYNGSFGCRWTNDRDASAISTCTATVSPLLETNYTLEVTDASGLSATDSVVISLVDFSADAGPDSNILFGATATLTASWMGASCADTSCIACEWRLSDQTLVGSTCSIMVSPQATTQYFVTITDTSAAVSDADSATVFVTDRSAQLCGWNVVVMTSDEYPSGPNPNYICDATGTARRQTINGKPAIVLSDLEVQNVRITGHISVETGADDDLIGFLWGWQNPKHAYLLTWKQLNQNWTAACGNGAAGIAVKKIDGAPAGPETISFNPSFGFNATDYVYACAIGWSTDRANAGLLDDSSIFLVSPVDTGAFAVGWADFLTYRFEFYYTPARTKVFVYEDDLMNGSTANLITTLTIVDSSYPSGAFAFFSNSQEQAAFGDFVLASLTDFAADAGLDVAITGGQSATLTGSARLAVPPYQCEWRDGATTIPSTDCEAMVSPAATTVYTLTVTDDFGRTATDDITVSVAP